MASSAALRAEFQAALKAAAEELVPGGQPAPEEGMPAAPRSSLKCRTSIVPATYDNARKRSSGGKRKSQAGRISVKLSTAEGAMLQRRLRALIHLCMSYIPLDALCLSASDTDTHAVGSDLRVCAAAPTPKAPWTLKATLQELCDAGTLTLPPDKLSPTVRAGRRSTTQADAFLTTSPSDQAHETFPPASAALQDAMHSSDVQGRSTQDLAPRTHIAAETAAVSRLQHSLHESGTLFSTQRPLSAQPMLWNLLACQHPDGEAAPLQATQIAPSPFGHRHGCLPTLVLLACPAVAAVYLAQAAAPPPRPTTPSTASPLAPAPVPGLSQFESALLSEAATSPAWHLGPTDAAMVTRHCEVAALSLGYASALTLETRVQSALSAFFVAKRTFLHVQAGAVQPGASESPQQQHSISLELARCGIGIFDIPAVLFVLGTPLAALWILLDSALMVTSGTSGAESDAEALVATGAGGARGSVHRSRNPRLSASVGLFDSGMHELPQWLQDVDLNAVPNLMLMPVDPAGVRPSPVHKLDACMLMGRG